MLEQQHYAPASALLPLEREELLRRICVRPPYFALLDLLWTGTDFTATAIPERLASEEVGPMETSEICRHAAISGLCAVAMTLGDQERRYYLAQDATYQGHANPAPYGTPVHFEAHPLTLNKRQATVNIRCTSAGRALAELQVTYTILNEAAFARLFRSKYVARPAGVQHSRMPDPPEGILSVVGDTHTLRVAQIPEESCAGHFDHYPALPVAVLMGEIGKVAARMYGRPYRVERATMTALDFCWAGESARFDVTSQREEGVYIGAALASDVVVSDAVIKFVPAERTRPAPVPDGI